MVLLLACAPMPDEPRLDAVVPARGWQGESTAVLLTGDNFFPGVYVGDEPRVEANFTAWLETSPRTRLESLTLVDEGTLTAAVPPTDGFASGSYDLVLETPAGLQATLPGAFTITPTRAARLNLRAATAAYVAGETATVTLELLDTQGAVSAESHGVAVLMTSSREAPAMDIDTSLADESVSWSSTDTLAVTGSLVDGSATLDLTDLQTDDVTLQATSTDDPSYIDGASLLLSWAEGELDAMVVELPADDWVATAGEAFTVTLRLYDGGGFPYTPLQPVRLSEASGCGDFQEVVDVVGGVAEVEVTLTGACDANRLYAYNDPLGEVESALFSVQPSAHVGYRVEADDYAIVAGEEVFVDVTAVDAWDNRVTDAATTVTLSDSSGEFSGAPCTTLEEGQGNCRVSPTVATEALELVVSDDAGLEGRSSLLSVAAGDPVAATVEPAEEEVVAGEAFEVVVALVDVYGNSAEFSPGSDNPVSFTDDTGTASCAWVGKVGEDQVFSCTLTQATEASHLFAEVGPDGWVGSAEIPVRVVNGALAAVELELATELVAGVASPLGLRGVDAWGNPYLVQDDPVVDLADLGGSLSPASASLGADGSALVDVSVTLAGTDRILASQGGLPLGESADFEVVGAEAVSFDVDVPAWVEAGAAIGVTVTARDSWDNVATGFDGAVTVAGASFCDQGEAPSFVEGVATLGVPCPSAGLDEVLYATDSAGLSGESESFDVVDFDCEDGPEALLDLGGGSNVHCLVGPVVVNADGAASSAGAAAISSYLLQDSDGTVERTATGTATFVYEDAGTRRITLVVIDTEACGASDDELVYVAEADGEPAGPISATPSASSVGGTSSVSVDIEAVDCTGDLAVGQVLRLRPDIGLTDAVPEADGLSLELDGAGAATLTWDFDSGHPGLATLHLASESGGAYGVAQVELSDAAHPRVISVEPAGRDLSLWSTLTIVFDEPLRSDSASGASLLGPDGDIALSGTVDGATLSLVPATPVDGAAGAYTLTLDDRGVRDLVGLRLDGDWSGDSADFVVQFGDVPDETPVVSSCDLSGSRFVPDGADGEGEEADAVELTPITSATPTWWWLEVEDGIGLRVRSDRSSGTNPSMSWDGRGDDGFIVPSGTYQLILHAIDSYGSVADACTTAVSVAQHLEAP